MQCAWLHENYSGPSSRLVILLDVLEPTHATPSQCVNAMTAHLSRAFTVTRSSMLCRSMTVRKLERMGGSGRGETRALLIRRLAQGFGAVGAWWRDEASTKRDLFKLDEEH
eukprot:1577161-Rhodomonas_salina.4